MNPAESTKARGSSRRSHDLVEANIFAPPEIEALLGAADGRWRIIILTAVLTGLREGDLLGLSWGDIDWRTRQIHVRQQYTAGRFSELKTKAHGVGWTYRPGWWPSLDAGGCSARGGSRSRVPDRRRYPDSPCDLLDRGFYPALRRAELRKIRFHDLRHTYASLLIANGGTRNASRRSWVIRPSTPRWTFTVT